MAKLVRHAQILQQLHCVASKQATLGTRGDSGHYAGDMRKAASLNELGEEILSLAIHHDERGEVLHINLPDGLHTELRILQHLDLHGVDVDTINVQIPCGCMLIEVKRL